MSKTRGALATIVGADANLRAVLARVRQIAPTRTPVVVTGESGTGKELLARALHELGPSPAGPFVTVNCGALPRELAESELFGHERGAFTGAAARRHGWFEEATGGTLVLDEIGELPRDLQPKLLRVLETGRIRRVGGNGERAIDVRVVAMTLRDLRRDASRGTFRIDLYHRLAGIELRLPPLRQRRADIALLAHHFLDEVAAEVGSRVLDAGALARLEAYDWPGNVRELRNAIRRAAILSSDRIEARVLELGNPPSCELRLVSHAADGELEPVAAAAAAGRYAASAGSGSGYTAASAPPTPVGEDTLTLGGKTYREIEKEILSWALRRCPESRRRAAQLLGISRSTFCDRVKRLGLVTAR